MLNFPTIILNHRGILEMYQILQYPRILLGNLRDNIRHDISNAAEFMLTVFNNSLPHFYLHIHFPPVPIDLEGSLRDYTC